MKMQIGIMSRTFDRWTLEEELDAVTGHGLTCMQFDLLHALHGLMSTITGDGD